MEIYRNLIFTFIFISLMVFVPYSFSFVRLEAEAKIVDVIITKTEFIPKIITVQQGDQIRWINQSPLSEQPESLHHGYGDEVGLDFIHNNYLALSSPDRETEIPPGGLRISEPLNRIGWHGYHNHNAGGFWQGVVIVKDSVTGLPNLDYLQSKIPQVPLHLGASGQVVADLQTFLSYNSTFYPEGLITGYFDKTTEEAVSELQEHHEILHESFIYDSQNFGVYESKTINFLNALFQNDKTRLMVPVITSGSVLQQPKTSSLITASQVEINQIQEQITKIFKMLKLLQTQITNFISQ